MSALAGRGKEDLVHKLLAGLLEQGLERAYDSPEAAVKRGIGAGKIDESLECVAQMPDALQMMAQRMRLRAGADDQHVARAHAAVEAAVQQDAVNQPAQAQRNGHQTHRDQHDAARNIVGVNQIKGAGEQQAGGEAGLHAQPLLMQKIGEPRGSIQMQAPAGDHQRRP